MVVAFAGLAKLVSYIMGISLPDRGSEALPKRCVVSLLE